MEKADKFMGCNCLIKGPPGMGKTKLFVTFAIFYIQCG